MPHNRLLVLGLACGEKQQRPLSNFCEKFEKRVILMLFSQGERSHHSGCASAYGGSIAYSCMPVNGRTQSDTAKTCTKDSLLLDPWLTRCCGYRSHGWSLSQPKVTLVWSVSNPLTAVAQRGISRSRPRCRRENSNITLMRGYDGCRVLFCTAIAGVSNLHNTVTF